MSIRRAPSGPSPCSCARVLAVRTGRGLRQGLPPPRSAARTTVPSSTSPAAAASSGASSRSGPGGPTPPARRASPCAPVAGAGVSGDRRSMPRAAVAARPPARASWVSAVRSLRAADQPIDTWSSCIAEVGIVSALAGTASRRHSATRAAAVYWAIIRPLSTPGSWARNGGRPWLRAASRNRSPPRSWRRRRRRRWPAGRRRAPAAPVEVAHRLDPAVGEHDRVVDRGRQLVVGARVGEGQGVAGGRGPGGRSAASRRPGPGGRRCGARRRWPSRPGGRRCWRPTPAGRGGGAGRRGRRRGGRCRGGPPRSWPRPRSAARSSPARSAQASTSMPSMPSVPLTSARPSLASSVRSRAVATWASGARSPLQPASRTPGRRAGRRRAGPGARPPARAGPR